MRCHCVVAGNIYVPPIRGSFSLMHPSTQPFWKFQLNFIVLLKNFLTQNPLNYPWNYFNFLGMVNYTMQNYAVNEKIFRTGLQYNNGYGGVVVLWLMCSGSSSLGSSPDWEHCVVFLGKPFTLTVSLSTQVYIWVAANFMLGEPCDGLTSFPGGVEILLIASCYRNLDKLQPD